MKNIDRSKIDPRYLPSSYWKGDAAFGNPGHAIVHRADAAETAFIEHQTHYTYLEAVNALRPLRYNDFLRIDSSIPALVKKYDMRKVTQFAEPPVPFADMGGETQARPRVQREEVSKLNFKFITGYHVFYDEIDRARLFNMPIDTYETQAVAEAAEKQIDDIAVSGDVASGLTLGLTGLFNLPDVAQATGGSATAWSAATVDQMTDDLWALMNSVRVGSKETATCTNIILPDAQFQLLAKKRDTYGNTALDLFMKSIQGLGRTAPKIDSWTKADTADGSGGPRAVAYDANHQLGPRLLLSERLRNFGPPRLISGGWYQDMCYTTGGVICPAATTVVYLDSLG